MKLIKRFSAFLLLLVTFNLTAYNGSVAKGYKPIIIDELEKIIYISYN